MAGFPMRNAFQAKIANLNVVPKEKELSYAQIAKLPRPGHGWDRRLLWSVLY